MGDIDLRAELAQQQRDAHTWLLVAGAMLTGLDLLCAYTLGWVLELTAGVRGEVVRFELLLLACIALLWWLERTRPVRCCVLGIAGYWAAQLYLAGIAPTLLVFAMVIKVATTAGLFRCIRTVRRTEHELSQLEGASLPAARGWLRRARPRGR
jgi:hypothetical protein